MPLSKQQLVLLQSAFRPHAPIEDPAFFVGRDGQRDRVREALSEPGLQVVVYGERGCGKTSLTNVATAGVRRIKVFCEADADFQRILQDIALEFQKTDPKRIVYDAVKDTIAAGGVAFPLGKLTGNLLLSILPSDGPFCVILDELDRVKNRKVVELLAEVAKNAATNRPNLTFVMVGVADTANGLLAGHASNFRNIREVSLDRMTEIELRGIVTRGEQILDLTFSADAVNQILQLCDRMPYYLHLLATNAARVAVEIGSPIVELDDLAKGSIQAADDADQQLRETYEHAVMSERGSRIYQRIVWAMANLEQKSNNVGDITTQANNIALEEADEPVTPQGIGAALKKLASSGKKEIISQQIPGVYRFSSPLMKGFIRLIRYRR